MNLTELSKEIHLDNLDRGFYLEYQQIKQLAEKHNPELVKANDHLFSSQRYALIMSEVSEALEAHRSQKQATLSYFEHIYDLNKSEDWEFPKIEFETYIKDSEADELSDVIIRVLDYAGFKGIDIHKHIMYKLEYNKLRGHRHGKSF